MRDNFTVVKAGLNYLSRVPEDKAKTASQDSDFVKDALVRRFAHKLMEIVVVSFSTNDNLELVVRHFDEIALHGFLSNGHPPSIKLNKNGLQVRNRRIVQSVETDSWSVYGIDKVNIEYTCERELDG